MEKYSKKEEEFLLKGELLNPNQSGFHTCDSCINQLLAITHQIFEAFDCNPPLEIRSVFWIYRKHLTKFGMKVYFISLNLWESLENFTSFMKTTCQVDSKELFLMVKHLCGDQS